MTRKTALTILIIVGVVAALIVAYFTFFTGNNTGRDDGVVIRSPREGVSFPVSDIENDNQPSEDSGVPDRFRDIPRLRQIYDEPIAGFTTYERLDDSTATSTFDTVYRFVDRASGNVLETLSDSLDVERVTNTTIPKVREAFFFNEGEGVVLRYIGNNGIIETFVGDIVDQETATSTATSTPQSTSSIKRLVGDFITSNIPYLTKSSKSDEFFYTTNQGLGYVFNGNAPQNQIQVLDSPVVEWSLDWFSDTILLSVAPTYLEDGVIFSLNPSNGLFSKVVDDRRGLLGKENVDGSRILVSEVNNGEVNTFIYDRESKLSFNLSFNTLVDKCVWSSTDINVFYCATPENLNTSNYPDVWYQGDVSFNDQLYKIDLEADILIELPGINKGFDMINLQLTEAEDFVLFQNKKDLTLWSLDIKE